MTPLKSIFLLAALPISFVATPIMAVDSVGQMEAQTCSSAAKTIKATGSFIRVRGYCSTLTIIGDGNMVMLDRAGSIIVNGTGNRVSYKDLNAPVRKGGKMVHPRVSAKGIGNLVEWTMGKELTLADISGGDSDDEE